MRKEGGSMIEGEGVGYSTIRSSRKKTAREHLIRGSSPFGKRKSMRIGGGK